MTETRYALAAAQVFNGETTHRDAAIVIEAGRVADVVPTDTVPADIPVHDPGIALLAPGLVDLQVNGGGGVLLNDAPSVESISRIAGAHMALGTTSLLPTLITDTPRITAAAIDAAQEACRSVLGVIGLHLEGPHLDQRKAGVHDLELIRPLNADDMTLLVKAAAALPTLLLTVAPEATSTSQIGQLSRAGAIISLGHSACGQRVAHDAYAAGATMATHLFNAMATLHHREPGLVGHALVNPAVNIGLIADGHHLAVDVLKLAILSKSKCPGRAFLVSDAMPSVGSDALEFMLNGNVIRRKNGMLTREDGTLAGADIALLDAVRFLVDTLGTPREEALRMASLYPAESIGQARHYGHLKPGASADIIGLTDRLDLTCVWKAGSPVSL